MTDQDNLRERVAAAIYKNQDVVVGDAGEIFGDAAQAVIDEFELTVELRAERVMASPDPLEFDYTRRVVGKWENQ